MVWPVERECSECGIIQPLEALNLFTERRIAGWATSGRGSSPRRPVDLHLCSDCASIRMRTERNARFWSFFRPMLLVGAIAAGIMAIMAFIPEDSYDDSETDLPVLNLEGAGVVLAPATSKRTVDAVSSIDPILSAQQAVTGGDVTRDSIPQTFDRAEPIGSIAKAGKAVSGSARAP